MRIREPFTELIHATAAGGSREAENRRLSQERIRDNSPDLFLSPFRHRRPGCVATVSHMQRPDQGDATKTKSHRAYAIFNLEMFDIQSGAITALYPIASCLRLFQRSKYLSRR